MLKVFRSISHYVSQAPTVVTLGTFDGVHLGHQQVIAHLIDAAHEQKGESLLLTFFPHPRMVLKSGEPIYLLNTLEEKIERLEKSGLHNLVIHPFDEAFSQLSAEDFVKEILVDRFKVRKIIVGHDHRFGKNRTANYEDLVEFGKKYGFEVAQIPAHLIHDMAVSSTKIRHALQEGDVRLAQEFLGHPYSITGKVIRGNQLGRTIGYPTANLELQDTSKLIPAIGSYAVRIQIDDLTQNGMMNIGFRPTIGGSQLSLEVHIFDFNQDLYGKDIRIEFHSKLRNEMKFESIEALKAQLAKDEEHARNLLNP